MAKKIPNADKAIRLLYSLSTALDLHSSGLADADFNMKKTAAPHKVVDVMRCNEYIDIDTPDDELWKMAHEALRATRRVIL